MIAFAASAPSSQACASCQTPLVPGALTCARCGMPCFQLAAAAPAAATVRELVVVEGTMAGTKIPLPAEGAELCLGRHDLLRSPPWIVDVDLGRLMGLSAGEGPPVSRDHASLARRAGELLVTPRGQAPTLHRPSGSTSWTVLATQTAQAVKPGDRLAFGHGGRALVFEAI